MVNDNFGFYVKGGISEVTVETLESIDVGTDSSAYGNETIHGVATGVGIKGVLLSSERDSLIIPIFFTGN